MPAEATIVSASWPRPPGRKLYLGGLALAIVGSVFFSAKAIVVKLAYRHGVDATTLITLRMAFAAPFFAATYAWASRGRAPLTPRDHGSLAAIGLIGYYLASYLDFLGLQYITAGLERLILYLNPTIVLLLSVLLFKYRLSRIDALALLLAYGGIVAVFWHDVGFDDGNTPLGAALVFASAVAYAIYLTWSGQIVRRIGAIRLTSYAMLASTGGVFAQFAVLNPLTALHQPLPVYGLSLINGTLCTVLPVIATMLAVDRIGAGNTSLAAMVGPVSTILLAWIFLGEAVSAWQLAGTGLVLAGVFVLSRRSGAA